MSVARLKGETAPIVLWTPPSEIEPAALQQLKNIAALPWIHAHVAVMPDVHLGKGATVGSVIALRGAVSPAAVGVDLGCGMTAVRTSLDAADLPDDLKALRLSIEAAIPVGFAKHGDPVRGVERDALWNDFDGLDPAVKGLARRALAQVGTLGGGNHFIELCVDTSGNVWVMLHSGSRNIGNEIAKVHIGRAKTLKHNASLPDRDLAVFLDGTPEMTAYTHDAFWAQRYAKLNRDTMLRLYQDVLRLHFPDVRFDRAISCHHNYVSRERHYGADVIVTRKGAIRAGRGELGIIPGSMGTKSYVVSGLGNAEAFESAPHGAGRRMSRNQAKKAYTQQDLIRQTAGVECRKDRRVVDEIPAAYKDIDDVIAKSATLVEVLTELKQVLCVKG